MHLSEWLNLGVALGTIALAILTYFLAQETSKSVRSQYYLQAIDSAPLIVAELVERENGESVQLVIVNKGKGSSAQLYFSAVINGTTTSAAQWNVPPLAPNGTFVVPGLMSQSLNQNRWNRWVQHLRIRYWDMYDNYYITEYRQLTPTLAHYIWRRPWIGKALGFLEPKFCSGNLRSKDLDWEIEPHERMPDIKYPPEEFNE